MLNDYNGGLNEGAPNGIWRYVTFLIFFFSELTRWQFRFFIRLIEAV